MKNKLLAILIVMLSVSSFSYAQVEDKVAKKSVGSLVGKTFKKAILPVTVLFAAADAQAAYEQNCKHLKSDEEKTSCTTEYFIKGQVNDAKEIAEDARITWKYVVVPEAKEFWAENGDEIKAGASNAIDSIVDGTINFVDFIGSK